MVEKLRAQFLRQSIRLVLCEKNLGANGKVSSLAQLAAEAKYSIFLVNDSDIRLRRLSEDGDCGIAVAEYRPGDLPLPWSTGKDVSIATGVARHQHRFCTRGSGGETDRRRLAFWAGINTGFRRADLEAIGGFESIVDYLADDYELGKRIAERGSKVVLSKAVVETFLPVYVSLDSSRISCAGLDDSSFAARRLCRLLLTYTLPWAAFVIACSGKNMGMGIIDNSQSCCG